MAELQYNRSPLFMRKQPGGVWTIENLPEHPGNIFFVDSGATGATDAATYGKSPDTPLATLDYAIGLCTASNGDTIYVMPGHAETKSASGSLWAADVAGIHIIGLGEGALRPTFTLSHVSAVTTISAANITVENIIYACGIDSVAAPLTVSAADVTLRNLEFRDAANVEFVLAVATTNAADRLHVDGLHYRGDMATGDALTIGIDLAGVYDALIENCIFESKAASTAWVNLSTACKNVHVRKCIFNDVTTTLTKDVVDTATGSTWSAYDSFDLRGGYEFAGGSGSALAQKTGVTGASSAAVSTVDSKVTSVGMVASSGATSGAVSTVDSKVTSVGVVAGSGATSGAVSTADSKVTSVGVVAGSGATSGAVSTADSKITSVGVVAGSGSTSGAVSTVDSKVTSVGVVAGSGATSAAVSTVSSLATVINNWDVRTTKKTGLAIDGGDVADVFTIAGGPIEVLGLNMVITTAVSANACAVYWMSDPTLASATDSEMCAGADINAAAIGDVFSIIDADGTQAWVKNATGTQVGRMIEIGSQFVLDGGIDFKAANADPTTGVADVYLTWRPLVAGTTVTTS